VYLRLLSSTDILPDSLIGTPSATQPVYEYLFTIENQPTFESPLVFSVSNTLFSGNALLVGNIDLDGKDFNVKKPAVWNATTSVFQYKLLFELWLFNSKLGSMQYNNRFVFLQLKPQNLATSQLQRSTKFLQNVLEIHRQNLDHKTRAANSVCEESVLIGIILFILNANS